MFNRARNVVVNDGLFVVNGDSSTQGKLDRLLDEVAPHAILNAGGRADEVRCYPGTREEVIRKIENWMDGEALGQSRMMWLSGPAGAGKSAICQTVAEHCRERGIYSANFFFFRGDDTRNHAQPLVATVAYQLLDFYPGLKEILADCLAAQPLICKASTEEQFIRLISSPMQTLQPSPSMPITLIIDGLDECDDGRKQEQVLVALHALVEKANSLFRVLIASRAEPHLVMSFNKIGTSVESIFLDGKYRPQDDIRRFVIAKFDEIKRIHHLAHTLNKHWPEGADIDAITDKSSGQFIYAATVLRFIEYSTVSPALSLLTIQGMRPATDHSPLAQLDAVYSYIFSQTHDIQTVKLVLGAVFIKGLQDGPVQKQIVLQDLLYRGGYEAIEIESFVADLAAIVKFSSGPPIELVFYHASLSDYLQNERRSGVYYVNVAAIAAEWTSLCLKKMDEPYSLELGTLILQHVKKATPELSRSLLNASERNLDHGHTERFFKVGGWWAPLMSKIYRLYFESDRALYRQILRRWLCFYINNYKNIPRIADTFKYGSVSRRVYTYYTWYLLTESLKSAVRLNT